MFQITNQHIVVAVVAAVVMGGIPDGGRKRVVE